MFMSNIKNIRKEKGLSQEELANLVGVTRVAISRYENGDREPKQEILKKIASALEVSIHGLYGDIFNEFNSMVDLNKLKLELNEIEVMNNLLKSFGYEVKHRQITDEEYEIELNKNGEHKILTELQYNEFKNRIKNFIDFEFYNMK